MRKPIPIPILDGIFMDDPEGDRRLRLPKATIHSVFDLDNPPPSSGIEAFPQGDDIPPAYLQRSAAYLHQQVATKQHVLVQGGRGLAYTALPVLVYLLEYVGMDFPNAYTLIANQFYLFKLPKLPLSKLQAHYGFGQDIQDSGLEIELIGSINLGISPIMDGVYVSGSDVLLQPALPQEMGIQAVLRLDDDNRDRGQWGQPYHLLDMPIIDGLPIPSQQLRQGAAFIHQQVEAGRRVLVHCQAGVSRSVTMMLAYLIEYRGWLLPDAYRQVLIRRAVARPHPALVISLIDCYNLPYAREAAAEFDFLQEILLPIR